MLKVPEDIRIYVCLEPVDFRKGMNSLCVYVVEHYSGDLMTGDIYLFLNKKRDQVKGLYWHRNGFVLHQKRLEKGKIVIPALEKEVPYLEITELQLQGLLAGLDFMLMQQFSEINYTELF